MYVCRNFYSIFLLEEMYNIYYCNFEKFLPSISSFEIFPLSLASILSTPSLETLVAFDKAALLIGFREHLSKDPPVPLLVKVGPKG